MSCLVSHSENTILLRIIGFHHISCWFVVQISCHNTGSAISLNSCGRVPTSCGVKWWLQSKKLSWPCHSRTFPLRKMCLFRPSWGLQKMGLHFGLSHGALRALPGMTRCSELQQLPGSKLGIPLISTPSILPSLLRFSAKAWVQSFTGLGSGVALRVCH